jgi:hypothetical protein
MIKLAICAALAVALVTSGAASVQAQAPGDKPISGITLESSMPIVATVVGIDPNGETVTLVLPGGTTTTQKVGSSVQNLRRLKIGEVVTVTYKERLTVIASEPNAQTPPPQEAVAAIKAYEPRAEFGALAAQDVRNFYVVSADPAARKISVVDPNGGAVRTLTVDDTVAQAQLPLLQQGYKLTVIGVQAVIVAIEKRAGEGPALISNLPSR